MYSNYLDSMYEIFRGSAIEVLGISDEAASNLARVAIEQYKAENPNVNVDGILSKHKELLPVMGLSSSRELDKFITYAKEQGTKMSFDAMEMGILAAGRKDMQNGLAEILNPLEFNKPDCSECSEEMDNRGRSKKKF
jgi:hypothetical protein